MQKASRACMPQALRPAVLGRNPQSSHPAAHDVRNRVHHERPKGCFKADENIRERTARSSVFDVEPDSRAELFTQWELLKTFAFRSADDKLIRRPVNVAQKKVRGLASSQPIHGKKQQKCFGTEVRRFPTVRVAHC